MKKKRIWFPRRGQRVEILCKEILGRSRKNHFGRITRVNGGYIYVRPMWLKHVFEFYENEIRLAQ